MQDVDQQKALSILCYASVFFSPTIVSIIIPISILAASENPTVRANAREAINFQISFLVYLIVVIAVALIPAGILFFAPNPGVTFPSPNGGNVPIPADGSVGSSVAASLLVLMGALFFLLWVASIVLPILAIVQVAKRPEVPYRYPFIFRLL